MNIHLEELKNRKFETEDQFQCASNLLISQEFPALRGKYFHVQNENWNRRLAIQTNEGFRAETNSEFENRKIREGSKSKAKGMLSGVMDWIILHNGIMYKLELKLVGGVLSESQKKLIILYDKDCPNIPVVVAYNLYVVYMYCKWIVTNNLKINFPDNFKKFEY